MNAFAICSTVRLLSTAIEMGWISSEARGATTTPPTTIPVPSAEDLHEAVTDALHLRARVAQQRQLDDPGVDLARVDVGLAVADGGDLRVGEDVGGDRLEVERRHRVAEEVYIAIRPCIAATEASANTPVTSPAA